MRDVIRTCIGCREKLPQKTLIRFVCQQNAELQIDCRKRLRGRGAYVCFSQVCIQKAFKSPRRINSLLRAQLTNEVIMRFEQVLLQWVQQSASTTEEKEELR
ncbi:MAG: YlxR family protein [Candidatus Poribacteria bacterium]|nr:YlxR family protein [Candidatus Poribacteria bacterium]